MTKTDLKRTSICQKVCKTDLGPVKQTDLARLNELFKFEEGQLKSETTKNKIGYAVVD